MDRAELRKTNTNVLAYMGDAVYEQFVREFLVRENMIDVHKLHQAATKYVRAAAQAYAIRILFDELAPEEQDLVKRARNRKPVTMAKNADPLDYRWATALEALVGYLYLAGETDRLQEIMDRAIAITREHEVA